jgi:hypothetical protein
MYTYVWFLFWIDQSAFLVQKKKNTIFGPIKAALFSEQFGVILVCSGSSRPDLHESYPKSHVTLIYPQCDTPEIHTGPPEYQI